MNVISCRGVENQSYNSLRGSAAHHNVEVRTSAKKNHLRIKYELFRIISLNNSIRRFPIRPRSGPYEAKFAKLLQGPPASGIKDRMRFHAGLAQCYNQQLSLSV